jgi:hypothetical protein
MRVAAYAVQVMYLEYSKFCGGYFDGLIDEILILDKTIDGD